MSRLNESELFGKAFPAEHQQEPDNLRQDILDEIRDHLECAYRDELIRQRGDETKCWARVLERFGDPARIARQLWYDAMKEKIMKDTMIMISMAVMAVGLLLAVGLGWMALDQMQQNHEAMLVAMKSFQTVSNSVVSDQATLNVTLKTEDGKPVEGMNLRLHGNAFNESVGSSLEGTTNEKGVWEVGPIRPGSYGLTVYLISEEGCYVRNHHNVLLFAGNEKVLDLTIPEEKRIKVQPEFFVLNSLGGDSETLDSKLNLDKVPENILFYVEMFVRENPDQGKDIYGSIDMVLDKNGMIQNSPSQNSYYPSDKGDLSSGIPMPDYPWTIQDVEIGMIDPESGGFQKIDEIEYPDNKQPVIHKSNKSQAVLEIPLPKDKLNELVLREFVKDLPGYVGLDSSILNAFEGEIEEVFPVNKDAMILCDQPNRNHGDAGYVAIAENDGGVRALFGWDKEMDFNLEGNESLYLAVYNKKTTAGVNPSHIGVYPLVKDWTERVSWSSQPGAATTTVTVQGFIPEEGWKIFDVTRALQKMKEAGNNLTGVMLAFMDENKDEDTWSGYQFVSREESSSRRWNMKPVLLKVRHE